MFDDMFLFVNRIEAGEKLADELLAESLVTTASKEKLLVLRDRYKAEVSAEDRAESVRRGLGTNRRIQTRLA